eukprot:6203990-Pleurochrysis_carterae.AAC.1
MLSFAPSVSELHIHARARESTHRLHFPFTQQWTANSDLNLADEPSAACEGSISALKRSSR